MTGAMTAEAEIEIRPGQSNDTPDLVKACKRTLRACYTPFLGRTSVEAWIASELDSYLSVHSDDTWVATVGGTMCGCSVVTGQHLAFLLVDVGEQRRGIGTLLLRHAEELVFRRHDEIHLESFVANDRANAFYERCGWSRGNRHLDTKSGTDVWEFSKTKVRP